MGERGPERRRFRAGGTPEGGTIIGEPGSVASGPGRPKVDRAIGAAIMLANFYGTGSQFDTTVDFTGDEVSARHLAIELSDTEIVRRLMDLARGIQAGELTSHRDVSRVILGLGASIGPFGVVSEEIGEAAYHAARAVYVNQGRFTDNTEVAAKVAARQQPR